MRVVTRLLASLVLLAAVLVLGASPVSAQVNPLWDHYKLYQAVTPVPPPPFPVTLTDQFGPPFTHNVLPVEYWMNPVEKRLGPPSNAVFPINDPITHYVWWRITPQPMSVQVAVNNQFGDQTLLVNDAQWLLNPAYKNTQGSPLLRNHYKCYLCQGPPVNVPVNLIDQFDAWPATVLVPRFFCNPAAKQDPTGNYPIVDPNQHYVCYEYQPMDPGQFTATFNDQFVNAPLSIGPSQWLCVPTYKSGVTRAHQDTWGRMKILYR